MKTRILLLLLAVLVLGSFASAQQSPQRTYANVTNPDDVSGGKLLGGHGSNQGCVYCHAPHMTTGVNGVEVAGTYIPFRQGSIRSVNTGGSYGGGTAWANGYAAANVTGWTADSLGGNIAGNVFLWERALPQTVTYTTYGGDTITKGDVTGPGSAASHTLLCMTCHDAAMSSHAVQNPYYADEVGGTTVSRNAVTGLAQYNNLGLDATNGQSLANDHPVHAVYTANGPDGVPRLWAINAQGKFTNSSFVLSGAVTGHPAKLFVEGGNSYVECASCHNPHRRTSYAFEKTDGTYQIGAAGSTENFIRGPFVTSVEKSNFCRSCHYDKSADFYNANGASN